MRTRTLAMALLLVTTVPAHAAPEPTHPGAPRQRTIRVSGEGRVTVRPDVAVVLVGVEATAKTVAPAVAEASARMRRVLDAVAKAGVVERDVQTTRHDVQVDRPWVNGRPGDVTGYTVVEEVRVKVRDLSKIGTVLDRVVAAGSNAIRGLTFERDDPAPAQSEALARAIGAARTKAEAMARAAGVATGGVLSIEEASGGRPVPVMRAALRAGPAEGAPVAPGELEITAEVNVTYAMR
jgi:uncharacterized protein